MVPISILILFAVTHLLGDFLLQTDWMALNKSKSNNALAIHCLVYSSCWLGFGGSFATVMFVTHFFDRLHHQPNYL